MKKEHKLKIDKAINLCESSFNNFIKHVETRDKDLAPKISSFLLENSYFAGGVFRSIFTNSKINDIDVFFVSEEAALEFKHLMFQSNIFLNSNISPNETFSWRDPNSSLMLTFITSEAGPPSYLLDNFDFTFNRHYFNMNTYKMKFDVATFTKVGCVLNHSGSVEEKCIGMINRAFRFLQEGFKIHPPSLERLLRYAINYKRDVTITSSVLSSDGRFLSEDRYKGAKGWYTEESFFNTGVYRDETLSDNVNRHTIIDDVSSGSWAGASTLGGNLTQRQAFAAGEIQQLQQQQEEPQRTESPRPRETPLQAYQRGYRPQDRQEPPQYQQYGGLTSSSED